MACGCPMAASNAVPEVYPGRDALISPVGDIMMAADHVVEIMTNSQMAVGLQGSGLGFSRRHSLIESGTNFIEKISRPA